MSSSGTHRPVGGRGEDVLEYLKQMQAENPAFYYAVHDENIFWVDPISRINYTHFGDTVRFDTTFRNQQINLPLVTFTGLNHHGQPVLFGCGLLFNESDASLVWVLQTWLHAMSGKAPISITTDPDRMIQMAVAQVLPGTRQRFCKWCILKETQEKLTHIYQTHLTFEADFKKCINDTETVEEFESCWQSLLDGYYLMDNEWLQSMYGARHQWVPVYMRDTFFGELCTSESTDDISSFFSGYVDVATTTQMLMTQYEKAVATWHEKELKADHDTMNTIPILKTPSPMEKQAASLYTRRIFLKFQDQLVETMANPATKINDSGTVAVYRVAKFGEDQKAHTVTFNSFMKANCSCQLFEYSGIICRHILSVFRAKNVLTLPSQYILTRWTRNAKSGEPVSVSAPELPTDAQDPIIARCNNLRQEAIKFVEEGAKSIHIYNVAMDALQEAAKKVATAKKKKFATTQGETLANGDNQHACGEHPITLHQSTVEKQKKISELTAELDNANQRCEVYRAKLLAVLRDMEDQKLKLSVKVQNARLSLKD